MRLNDTHSRQHQISEKVLAVPHSGARQGHEHEFHAPIILSGGFGRELESQPEFFGIDEQFLCRVLVSIRVRGPNGERRRRGNNLDHRRDNGDDASR